MQRLGLQVVSCTRPTWVHRVDVVEVFGLEGEISLQGWKQGFWVAQPYEKRYGCDLQEEEARRGFFQDLETYDPRLVIVEWPCKLWCNLSEFHYSQSQQRRRLLKRLRRKELPLLELTRDVFARQNSHDAEALGENPLGSRAIRTQPNQEGLDMPGVHSTVGDMCRYQKSMLRYFHTLTCPKRGICMTIHFQQI
jgi:hypothetical protein